LDTRCGRCFAGGRIGQGHLVPTSLLVAATLTALMVVPQPSSGSFAGSSQPVWSTAPTCLGAVSTITGTAGDDTLRGTAGDDIIAGLGGDDVVRAGGRNDLVCGGAGTDRLLGGPGDDRLSGGGNGLREPYPDNPPDNVGDLLVGGPGDDVLDPGYDVETDAGGGFLPDTISYADAPVGVRVDLGAGTASGGDGDDTLVLEGRVEVEGSAYDDVLVGAEFSDDLYGGAGDDVLRGGPGRDYLQADPSDIPAPGEDPYDDRVYGGPGGDGIYVGNGDDVARGGSGDDNLVHGFGRADLLAGSGEDYLDTLLEFADGSRVDGGPGVDLAYVWAVVAGGRRLPDVEGRIALGPGELRMTRRGTTHAAVLAGLEQLRIPDGRWTVVGTAADEIFYGGDLRRDALVVRARGGDDRVSGTEGDDVLDGGFGRDVLYDSGGDDAESGFEVVKR
jgi:Ca2+-binding RTX toxin-like protein